jgi:hypothetical protein
MDRKPPALGVTEEMILGAESELGLRFPEALRNAWMLYNCNEMGGGWRIFPIFDPTNPRKTCGSVTLENLKGVWGRQVMAQGLVSIADNGTGTQLVLKVVSGLAGDTVFRWHHATRGLTVWKPGLVAIKRSAARSREAVLKLQQRFQREA